MKQPWEVKTKCRGCRSFKEGRSSYGAGHYSEAVGKCKINPKIDIRDATNHPGITCPLNRFMYQHKLTIINGGKIGGVKNEMSVL